MEEKNHITGDTNRIFEDACHGTYAYDLLNEAEKIWYEDINNMLGSFCTENVTLSPKGLEMGLTEKDIDILSMNTRTNKQGLATMQTSFEVRSRDELNRIIDKIRNVESVIDIERTTG